MRLGFVAEAGRNFSLNTKAYALGFHRIFRNNPLDNYITLMTRQSETNCPGNHCTRVHMFSNPRVNDSFGLPMGTFTGNDNARAISEEAHRVSAFR